MTTSLKDSIQQHSLNDSIVQIQQRDSIQNIKKDTIVADTIPLYYKELFIPGDSIKWSSLGHKPPGFDGNPIPNRLSTEDGITGLLLLCFILTAYVFAKAKKTLLGQAKNLFNRKEHTDSFSKTTSAELRYQLLLRLQTCILMGIFVYDYFHDINSSVFSEKHTYLILGVYIGIFILFYVLKWIFYSFLGWIFFDKNITKSWLESYSTITYYLGFCFFPVILLTIYFNLSASIILIIGAILVIFAQTLMFYKWLKLFFNNLYGILYLIVYFCALEILPCLLLIQGLLQTNIMLQIKL